MLSVRDLHVRLNGKEVLKGINIQIEGRHALLGPNGSGKSTFAKCIMGILKPSKGRIYFNGKDITKLSIEERVRLGICMAFQHTPKLPIKLGELISAVKRRDVELGDLAKKRIGEMSGGEMKLAELLQALSLDPRFLILDEIDSGLDYENLRKVGRLIRKCKCDMLVITHRGDILRWVKPDLCHVMIDGRIICSIRDWKLVLKTIKRYGYAKCEECLRRR